MTKGRSEPSGGVLPIYRLLLPRQRLKSLHGIQEPILSPVEIPGSPKQAKAVRLPLAKACPLLRTAAENHMFTTSA